MDLKFLLVDDEEDILEIIQDRLEAYGFAVVTARNGREALKKLSIIKQIFDTSQPMDNIGQNTIIFAIIPTRFCGWWA